MANKEKVHLKWWFQLICVAVFIGGIILVVQYFKTPQYDHPKKVSSYSSLRRVNGSPDDVTCYFLKAVKKQDVKLLKKTLLEEMLQQYNENIFEGDMNDSDLKEMLTKANEEIIKTYGEDWYDNLSIDKAEEASEDGFTDSVLTLKCKEKEFKCQMAVCKVKGKYYVHPDSADKILTNFNKDEKKTENEKK